MVSDERHGSDALLQGSLRPGFVQRRLSTPIAEPFQPAHGSLQYRARLSVHIGARSCWQTCCAIRDATSLGTGSLPAACSPLGLVQNRFGTIRGGTCFAATIGTIGLARRRRLWNVTAEQRFRTRPTPSLGTRTSALCPASVRTEDPVARTKPARTAPKLPGGLHFTEHLPILFLISSFQHWALSLAIRKTGVLCGAAPAAGNGAAYGHWTLRL